MTYERVLETRPEAKEKLHAFLIDLRKSVGLDDFVIGDTKLMESVNRKARDDYEGDHLAVLDHERGKGIVSDPLSVLKTKLQLSNPNSNLMLKHGAEIVTLNDLFENPKIKTGYRCINTKIALPVGNAEPHTVEIQIVASQIEDLYERTHEEINFARSIAENARNREMTQDEKKLMAFAMAKCRYHNQKASRDHGYDDLLDPRIHSKHALSSTREDRMEAMLYQYEYQKTEYQKFILE